MSATHRPQVSVWYCDCQTKVSALSAQHRMCDRQRRGYYSVGDTAIHRNATAGVDAATASPIGPRHNAPCLPALPYRVLGSVHCIVIYDPRIQKGGVSTAASPSYASRSLL